MKISFTAIFFFLTLTLLAQKETVETLKLDLPKNILEPEIVSFDKTGIFLDDKKCFNYELFHNHDVAGRIIKNYYEIRSLEKELLFSGEISNNNSLKVFENLITFHTLDNNKYKNSKIVGRNSLILNLSSNQVLNNDCSINNDNLKLFFERSNENK